MGLIKFKPTNKRKKTMISIPILSKDVKKHFMTLFCQ